jgi:uncharacterized protein (DUF486 family)
VFAWYTTGTIGSSTALRRRSLTCMVTRGLPVYVYSLAVPADVLARFTLNASTACS